MSFPSDTKTSDKKTSTTGYTPIKHLLATKKRYQPYSKSKKAEEKETKRKEYLEEVKKCQEEDTLLIYCDGACERNGKFDAKAGYGVFFGDGDNRNISCPVPAETRQTNSEAELHAVLHIFQTIDETQKVLIKTDSAFVIAVIHSYMADWKEHGWKKKSDGKPPVNLVTVQKMDSLWSNTRKQNTVLKFIKGHSQSYGNDQADDLAKKGVKKMY